MRVFGHGFDGNAAHFIQSCAAHDGRRPAEHGGIPRVVALLNEVVKERIFNRQTPVEMHILLERIRRIKVMRRLHERNLRILDEPAHGREEKVA